MSAGIRGSAAHAERVDMSEVLSNDDIAKAIVAAKGDVKLVAERIHGSDSPANVAAVLDAFFHADPMKLQDMLRTLMLVSMLELLDAVKGELLTKVDEMSPGELTRLMQLVVAAIQGGPQVQLNQQNNFGTDENVMKLAVRMGLI